MGDRRDKIRRRAMKEKLWTRRGVSARARRSRRQALQARLRAPRRRSPTSRRSARSSPMRRTSSGSPAAISPKPASTSTSSAATAHRRRSSWSRQARRWSVERAASTSSRRSPHRSAGARDRDHRASLAVLGHSQRGEADRQSQGNGRQDDRRRLARRRNRQLSRHHADGLGAAQDRRDASGLPAIRRAPSI